MILRILAGLPVLALFAYLAYHLVRYYPKETFLVVVFWTALAGMFLGAVYAVDPSSWPFQVKP